MSERQRFNYNVFFISVLFVWPVVKTFFLNLDGAGRVESVLTLLTIIINGKHLLKGTAVMKIWIVWVVYNLINLYFKGYHNNEYPFVWWSLTQLACPLVSLLVSYNCVLYDKDSFIKRVFYLFLFYVFLGATQMSMTMDTSRMENALGNSYLNNAIFIIPFLALYAKKYVRWDFKWISLVIVSFLFMIILLSGERKALVGLMIMLMGVVYARNSKKNISSLISLFIVFVIASLGIEYIADNTLVGERFVSQFEDTQYSDSFFLSLMGDRAYMYEDGFLVFLQQPWTGIGLTNFAYNPLNFKGLRLHTEYMVELTECGIVGSLLFLVFYLGMLFCLLKMIKSKLVPYESIVLGSALLSIISINFTAWTYSYPYYFIVFGMIYAHYNIVFAKITRLK